MQSELQRPERNVLEEAVHERRTCVHHTLILERSELGYLTGWYVCTDCWQRMMMR